MACPTLCSSPASCMDYFFSIRRLSVLSYLYGNVALLQKQESINQPKKPVWALLRQYFMECHGELFLQTEAGPRVVENLAKQEDKIARDSTGGGTDLLLK